MIPRSKKGGGSRSEESEERCEVGDEPSVVDCGDRGEWICGDWPREVEKCANQPGAGGAARRRSSRGGGERVPEAIRGIESTSGWPPRSSSKSSSSRYGSSEGFLAGGDRGYEEDGPARYWSLSESSPSSSFSTRPRLLLSAVPPLPTSLGFPSSSRSLLSS